MGLALTGLLASPALAFKRTEVGQPIRDFHLKTLDGEPFTLSEHLGAKATLVVFWATWNPRSAEALADFQKLQVERRGEGLKVVAVNVEREGLKAEDLARVRDEVARLGITYPVLLDWKLSVYNEYGVVAVPSTLLADGEGRVVELVEGYGTIARQEFPDRVLAALGVEAARPEASAAALPPAQDKAYRYLQMGELFLQRGMEERAEKAFRTAIREDPGYVKAHEALAELLESEGIELEAAEVRSQIAAMAGK
jgi:peroxiredoxin